MGKNEFSYDKWLQIRLIRSKDLLNVKIQEHRDGYIKRNVLRSSAYFFDLVKTIQESLISEIKVISSELSKDKFLSDSDIYSIKRNLLSFVEQFYSEALDQTFLVPANIVQNNKSESQKTVLNEIEILIHNLPISIPDKMSKLESQEKKSRDIMGNKVFIVHGHDGLAKLEMARTLEKGEFEAIILHEQASGGKTIIEKIESYTDVRFAVVLYTPCDMGRVQEVKVDEEKNRARQNVVFEHGYLIGKLGRERVCALVKGDIETPGDISGVVYITMDEAGAWKMALAKEMINAGIPVNMNTFCS